MNRYAIILLGSIIGALIHSSATADIRPGDVNLDGQIDAGDVALLEHHLESDSWLACAERVAADVAGSAEGGDFFIDMLDLDAIADPDSGLPANPLFSPYPTSPLPENSVGSQELRFMSFNTKHAGWCGFVPCNTTQTEKAELLVEIVQRHTPDIIGLQEGLGSTNAIVAALPQYEVASLPREAPGESLGSNAIFFEWILYRTDRFSLLDGAEYRVPDMVCPLLNSNRFITWARFEEVSTGNTFYVYDLHFCPNGSIDQTHAQRLVDFIANREHPDPVIVMGDFNQTPTAQSIQILRDSGLTHTYETVEGLEDAATHGGAGVIDYIFVSSQDVETCAVKVDREGGVSENGSGFFASDHWPVIAQVQFIEPDSDRVQQDIDNCPTDFNPDQEDSDSDGIGDVCDNCANANPDQADADEDGVGDSCDNCADTPNFDQVDSDSDGAGDACDNCVFHANASQSDADLDGLGTRCDADLDQSGGVDDDDFTLFQEAYDSSSATITDPFHQASDFNDSGAVNVQDFMYFSQLYNQDPQVTCADSALACCNMTAVPVAPTLANACVLDIVAPAVSVESTPAAEAGVIMVSDGGTVNFLASATDDIGLDSPTFLWDFGGGVVSDPADADRTDPSVSFDVRPRDEPIGRTDYTVSVQAFDTQGNRSTQTLKVVANRPPDVSVTLNGQAVEGSDPVLIGPGCPVQFEAVASDVDGIGFEIEAGGDPQTYAWTFGQGVTPDSASTSFEADPALHFRLAEGETSALIPVSVTGYDTFGLSTTKNFTLLLEGEDSDQDGVADHCDNCSEKANSGQSDYDRDGYGNLCDGDFSIPADHLIENDDDWCWGFALAMGMNPLQCGQATQSSTSCEFDDEYDPRADMNASGCINVQDFIYFSQQYNLGYSGPSGLSCAGDYLCGVRADDNDGDGIPNAEDICVDVWNPRGSPVCLEAVEAIGASIAASCGLGWELGLILPGLFGIRSRLRASRKKTHQVR